MYTDEEIDRFWLHDLGVAEGVESLVDEYLAEIDRSSLDLRLLVRTCEECREVPYSVYFAPVHVCPDCLEEVKEEYEKFHEGEL